MMDPSHAPPSSSSFIPRLPKQPTPRIKQKPSSVATQSDDAKYLAKYKDLKQKVKDIELDNDRLHLKVLKTKKNIQRLRIERAILYERLSSMPNAELPPQPPIHLQTQYPPYSPEIDAQFHAQQIAARRHPLYSSQLDHLRRPPPQPSLDVLHRPPSPPRLQRHPEPYQRPYLPMDVDHPPPPRSRRSHPAPPRDSAAPLPASLPPPPNTLPFAQPHPHARPSPHSPHMERHERGGDHGPPPEAAYPPYAPGARDRDRPHLGGPGLPPIRTRPNSHSQSPRPTSSSSHSGYAHPIQHPFMSAADDRPWERERERERERDVPPHHIRANGYRDEQPRRYDAEPSPGNGHLPPPPEHYPRSRRPSQTDPAAGSRDRDRDKDKDRREYPQDYQFEYPRRQEGQDPDPRRRYSEMEADLLEGPYDRDRSQPRPKPSARGSHDEGRRQDGRRTRENVNEDAPPVPRVQEGEAMD